MKKRWQIVHVSAFCCFPVMLDQDLHLLEDLLDLWYRPGAIDELGDGRGAVSHVGRDEREQRHGLSQEHIKK